MPREIKLSWDSTFCEALAQKPLRQILESLAIPLEQYPTLCGIDEAGRGCIAGSLFVCGVILKNLPKNLESALRDSKTLSQKKRDFLANSLQDYVEFKLVKKDAKAIDTKGLSLCLQESLQEILNTLNAPFYVFDGNCNFKIPHLKTLVKGDSKLRAISAASIIAKHAKDTEMQEMAHLYPHYDFARNKGYGTKAHIKAITQFGLCPIHRKSYQIKSLNSATLF
ncbi:ribonuclease HII [Helicobacter sp. MIT 11-5569]|uniref:ribonuclease HII n=1 Tax=Helicobacter sp. MIT 11-5569 TaxID=1548151 RepID=UPI0009E060E0|nr:ribonuclease HII [Helicobacter sp. MIT 11-5569]TLD84413.1 ribonuclease HII [Helicobacter sp. MIT 11-5569]